MTSHGCAWARLTAIRFQCARWLSSWPDTCGITWKCCGNVMSWVLNGARTKVKLMTLKASKLIAGATPPDHDREMDRDPERGRTMTRVVRPLWGRNSSRTLPVALPRLLHFRPSA